MKTYYLNGIGSKMIVEPRVEHMRFYSLEETKNGPDFVLRSIDYFEMVGNFSCIVYRKNGERRREFLDDFYTFNEKPCLVDRPYKEKRKAEIEKPGTFIYYHDSDDLALYGAVIK